MPFAHGQRDRRRAGKTCRRVRGGGRFSPVSGTGLQEKSLFFKGLCHGPGFASTAAARALARALGVQECFMSFSVNGSNANNPFALWQSLLQPDSAASNSAQSDPIASLLSTLGQGQGTATSATAAAGGASASSTSGTATSGSSSPQFGAQTLQTLFDMQASSSNSQSLLSQLGGSGGPDDANSSPQAQPSDGQYGHHHHHPTSGSWRRPDRRANRRRAVGRLRLFSDLEHSRRRQRGKQQSARAPDPDAGAIEQSGDGAERRHGLKPSTAPAISRDWT